MTTGAPPRVPFLDLLPAHRELAAELDAAALRVLSSGWYVLGPEVEAFEAEFAAWAGTRHCVGVGSGLDALHLALLAMGIGPGDEVLVPSNTYIATWLAVSRAGATPVPVEPDPATGNIDPDRLEDARTARTRAVLPVHLYGLPADMDAVTAFAARHGLPVLEDAAQAHGAAVGGRRAGALGTAGAWSFYPTKNLGAVGDGGAVTTDDDALADRLRSLRNYGSRRKYVHDERGLNSRLDELQAAMLRVRLEHLDAWNARRAAIAARYADGLAGTGLRLPWTPEGMTHAWHVYAVHAPGRDALAAALAERGVGTLMHYPTPPHLSGAYADMGLGEGALPIAERLARETLSLPMGPQLAPGDVEHVIASVRDVVDAGA
ncbi:MAG: DegT/DnrJ/EryC1/StrS family aminotransferase [Thermoleophilia bacterium]